jgi:hypothetical protein
MCGQWWWTPGYSKDWTFLRSIVLASKEKACQSLAVQHLISIFLPTNPTSSRWAGGKEAGVFAPAKNDMRGSWKKALDHCPARREDDIPCIQGQESDVCLLFFVV